MSENVELARKAYDAFSKGDIDTVLAMFDPAIEWREAEGNPYQPSGAPWIGPQAVVENLFVKLGSEWDGFAAVPEELLDAGDTVVALGRYRGACRATGRIIHAQMAHVWRVRDGKAAAFQQYADTLQFARATGAV